jgi:hypothetical protein
MLEIRRTAIFLDENELMEMERLIISQDKEETIRYLKESIYDKLIRCQRSH